jgi:hypothetical protein
MIRGAAIPNKRIIRTEDPAVLSPGRRNVAPALGCARESIPGTPAPVAGPGSAAAAFRFARLLESPPVQRQGTPAVRSPAAEQRSESTGLSARPASTADLPWLQSWAVHLGLPAPRSRRVRSFILLRDSQRAGYMAAREGMIDAGGGREPILWIVSAFLIPSLRSQGLILKFSEILSRQYYPKGKVGCRIATDNTRMLRVMARGGWKKLHSTRRYVDFMMELDGPYRASRKG